MRVYFLLLAAASLLTTPALAQDNSVALVSDTKLVCVVDQPDGTKKRTLEIPKTVVPGDTVVFSHSYQNKGAQPATDFVINNPLPSAVAFRSTTDANAAVSVDGGKSFGKLAALTVANADGTKRPAAADDVTHVRWTFAQAIPAGAKGQVGFEGEVR